MGSVYGEGNGEGVWVLYQEDRWWLSDISRKDFKDCKSGGAKGLIFSIEKDGEDLSVPLDQLELAEPA